jgi:RNA polymerase-binding transcription factor DksA
MQVEDQEGGMASSERGRLEADLTAVQEELNRLDLQLKHRPEFGHGKGSASWYTWEMAMERRERAEARLERLRGALDRLGEGEYGLCQLCGGSINPERLQVLPATSVCVACARKLAGNGAVRSDAREGAIRE